MEDPTNTDYGYIEYYQKSLENTSSPKERERMLNQIKFNEARRDYWTESVKSINHLVQYDEKPNHEIKEPKWDLYRLTISFQAKSRFQKILNRIDNLNIVLRFIPGCSRIERI